MSTMLHKKKWVAAIAVAGAAGLLASCQTMNAMTGGENVSLTGASEVPAVSTTASASGYVNVSNCAVSAKITTTGFAPTAAHIHEGAAGSNGPVIVPFTKTSDNTFEAPAGAKFTDAQCASYKAGRTYVNVHSAAHPGGEIRAQLKGS